MEEAVALKEKSIDTATRSLTVKSATLRLKKKNGKVFCLDTNISNGVSMATAQPKLQKIILQLQKYDLTSVCRPDMGGHPLTLRSRQ